MKLEELIEKRLADSAKFIFEWNGYKVYEIVYDWIRKVYKGSPTYALEKNGDYRKTTLKEGKEIYKIIKDKQKKVFNILLTPIICNKSQNCIKWSDNKIISGQKYHNACDADMTNLSIGFYEIMYKDILDGTSILNDEGYLTNENFAGDTIYSFNTIANLTTNAGKSKSERMDKELWPLYLQEYYEAYHCLANFWLLPMKLGRTGTKLNKYDSIDLFLLRLKESTDITDKYKEYFSCFNDLDNFQTHHFIHHMWAKRIVENRYRNKESKELVEDAMSSIEMRAMNIAESDKVYELYDYFTKLGLIHQGLDCNFQREFPKTISFCPGIRTEIDDKFIKDVEKVLKEHEKNKAAQD